MRGRRRMPRGLGIGAQGLALRVLGFSRTICCRASHIPGSLGVSYCAKHPLCEAITEGIGTKHVCLGTSQNRGHQFCNDPCFMRVQSFHHT